MPLSNDLQNYIFDHIMRRYAKRSEAVRAICAALNLSREAVYKRLRADKLMLLDELIVLARHFDISIDTFLFNSESELRFTFNPFTQKVTAIEDFWQILETDIHFLQALPDVAIHYASTEIPIFYHLFLPELMQFKLYVWGRSVWHLPYLQSQAFHFGVIPVPALVQAERLLEAHRRMSTVEIWSLNILDNTINQIEYHATSGLFRQSADAFLLCDALLSLIDHLQIMAQNGKKMRVGQPLGAGAGDFTLYHNEIIYTNNTILVQSGAGDAVYTTFGSPNFLKTTDTAFCQYTAQWFASVKQQSTPISQTGAKARQHFFDRLRRRVDSLRHRLSHILIDDIR